MKYTMKNLTVAAIVAAVSFLALFAQRGSAATTNVIVGFNGDHFSPTNTTISVNDSVIWTWAGIHHSSTSGTNGVPGDDNGVLPSGSWDSGIISTTPHTFTNTFTVAGVFSYYCSVHYSIGMTGQVFVVGANLPPTIGIANPLNGAVFAAPANVTIQASVTNGTAAVTNVQFLAGATVLGNATTSPYSATANNLAAGNYTLTAIALDVNNLSATNSVNISVVTPVSVSLANFFKQSGANFQLSYSANTGLNYVVQSSTNLTSWTPIATNTATSNPVVFVDVHATNSPNFYRVGRLPNP